MQRNDDRSGAALHQRLWVSISGALSVVCIDDPAKAGVFSPAITTLREQRFYLGRLSSDTLIASTMVQLHGLRLKPEFLLRTELIIRKSAQGRTMRCNELSRELCVRELSAVRRKNRGQSLP